MLSTEALVDLGETLKRQNFQVTSHQLIAARRALTGLLARDLLPSSLPELTPFLGPIFSTTPEEQQKFEDIYREWTNARFPQIRIARTNPSVGASKVRKREISRLAGFVLAGLSLCLAAFLYWAFHEKRLEVWVLTQDPPVSQVDVTEAKTGFVGKSVPRTPVQIPFRNWDLPLIVEMKAEGHETGSLRIDRPAPESIRNQLSRTAPVIDSEKSEPIRPPENDIALPAPVVPSPSPAPEIKPVPQEFVTTLQPWHVAALVGYLLLLASWWLWTSVRRAGWLQRQPASGNETEQRLKTDSGQFLAAFQHDLHFLGRELRRRRTVPSHDLDVIATIERTLQRGGLVTPVYESRVEPEYLFLVDRASLSDHLARMADELVRGLHERNLSVEKFFFDGTPGRCRHFALKRGAPDQGPQDLSQLFARYGERQIVLFSDAQKFLDPYTGRRAPWVEQVMSWSRPIVITPRLPKQWGRLEAEIQRTGLMLLPFNRLGLKLLSDAIGRDRARTSLLAVASARATPAYLRDFDRLLDHEAPSAEFVAKVINSLKQDLDERTFAWLCGCAVYPELHWGITLSVGECLLQGPNELAERLPMISQLPWLRVGYMPDWLREALLSDFSEEDQSRVRATLEKFLLNVSDAQGDAEPLRIAISGSAAKDTVRNFWQHVRGFFGRRAPVAATKSVEERVFLRFMSGAPSRLAVGVNENLRKLVFRDGASLAGLRPLAVLAAAGIGSALLLWQLPIYVTSEVLLEPNQPTLAALKALPEIAKPLEVEPAPDEKSALPIVPIDKADSLPAKLPDAAVVAMNEPKAALDSGTVNLNVLPWGEIFVNGVSRGMSPPMTFLKLAPGKYQIEVKNSPFTPHTVTLEFKAAETIALNHRFDMANEPTSATATQTISVVSRGAPKYPEEAIREGVTSGFVKAQLILAADGGVASVNMLEALGSPEYEKKMSDARRDSQPRTTSVAAAFSREATKALSQWKFNPGAAGRKYDIELTFKEPLAALAPETAPPQLLTGVIPFPDGGTYTGQYKLNALKLEVLHGFGEFVSSAFRYKGEFRDNKKQGKGTYTWANGNVYEGDFVDDEPFGRGKFVFATGDRYEGSYSKGAFNGRGVSTAKNGDKTDGYFVNGRAVGSAIYTFSSGDKFEGEMVNGVMSGRGKFTAKGGDSWEATFVNNLAERTGVYFFSNGDRYEGDFTAGKPTGKGAYYYSTGFKSEGNYVNAQLNGEGKFYFNDGSWFEGVFEQGLKRAKGFSVSKDGTKRAAEIVDGQVRIAGDAVASPVESVSSSATSPTQQRRGSDDKVALVIGNSQYPTGTLRTAVNDAQAVAKTLSDLGFKVMIKINADYATMRGVAVEFARVLDGANVAVFYYAGHGIQYRGQNYLAPIDAKLTTEASISFNAMPVTQILDIIEEAKVRHKFIILDASRNNPFSNAFTSPGLAKIQAPAGTIVSFAAAAGQVAPDGVDGVNSLFTRTLIREMRDSGLSAAPMFQRIQTLVAQESRNTQLPEFHNTPLFRVPFFFASKLSGDSQAAIEGEFWRSAKEGRKIEGYQLYLEKYPNGNFSSLARLEVERLKREKVQPDAKK